jgi:hypothetical protein
MEKCLIPIGCHRKIILHWQSISIKLFFFKVLIHFSILGQPIYTHRHRSANTVQHNTTQQLNKSKYSNFVSFLHQSNQFSHHERNLHKHKNQIRRRITITTKQQQQHKHQQKQKQILQPQRFTRKRRVTHFSNLPSMDVRRSIKRIHSNTFLVCFHSFSLSRSCCITLHNRVSWLWCETFSTVRCYCSDFIEFCCFVVVFVSFFVC